MDFDHGNADCGVVRHLLQLIRRLGMSGIQLINSSKNESFNV